MRHAAMERPKDHPRRAAPVIRMNEKSLALIICAILLTFLFDTMPHSSRDLSTELTAHRTPTFLQQLASFTALREVAEEQDLDWGAPSVLGGEKTFGLRLRPSDESSTSADSSSLSFLSTAPSSGHSAVSSRRRPHRRQRVGATHSEESKGATHSEESKGATHSEESKGATHSEESKGPTASSGAGEETATSPRSPWAQLHVMDIALRTGDGPLVERTDQLLRRERMYPIVYRCALRSVAAAREEELIHSPTTGIDTSRFWSCRTCGKAHDAVRESCLRCRRPGPYAKLFVGQTVKETDCARSVLRLLQATHPHIVVHRIEPHKQKDGERGKGCAALYVYPDAAQELKTKLHGNVFFDVDDDGQEGVDEKDAVHVYYVYATQRRWLDALVAFRTGRGRSHSAKKRNTLPWGTLVVQDAANTHQLRQS